MVENTLSAGETATLADALRALRSELLAGPDEAPPREGSKGPGRGMCSMRPGEPDAPQHFLSHLIEADPAITAYATHPRLVGMCEEYIGGEARIVESNCFMNTGNDPSTMSTGEFVPGWHRGADLPYATHSEGGLVHCNFVKALSNLTELAHKDDGGTVVSIR